MSYYLNLENQINRLLEDYKKHGKLIVAYDFENTVFDYDKKVIDFSKIIELLRECEKLGFYLIVYTCSGQDKYPFIKNFLDKNNIPYDFINKNIPSINSTSNKLFYNILLDDRAGLESAYLTLYNTIELIKENI